MDKINRQPKIKGSSIQSRLLVVIALLVVVPLAITIAVSIFLSMNNSRDQVLRQLQSVANLKDRELQTWVSDIHANLNSLLTEPVNSAQWEVLLQTQNQPDQSAYQASSALLLKRFEQALSNTNLFEEFFLMDAKGMVVLTTDDSQHGINKSSRQYFHQGLDAFYINPPYNDPTLNKLTMVAAMPVINASGQKIGVLAGRIAMGKLSDVMLTREGLGQTGQTYLVQQSHALLTESRFPGWDFGKFVFSQGINDAIEKSARGYGSYLDYRGVPVLGVFRWLPDLQMVLLAEQDQAEALQATYTTLVTNSIAAALALLAAILVAILATRRITKPIGQLAGTAEKIAAGDLELEARVNQRDEIGALAVAFNSMTAQLRGLIGNLEQRVSTRTQEVERRSMQLQLAADIARDAASVRDLHELLDSAVNMISDRFGYYHAGIFLVDERREYAILRAATGEAGRQLIAQEHKLKVGEVGIVGYVTGTGQPRIALDVGVDAVYFKNPVLPETRSEMALPLNAGGRIIGALDVQSKAAAAFDKDDVRVLQTMADQLAVAIENARLFQEMEQALQQLEISQSLATKGAWQGFAHRVGKPIGYHSRGLGVDPVAERLSEVDEAIKEGRSFIKSSKVEGKSLVVPIKIRDEVLGAINVRFEGDDLPDEAVTTYEEIATRLSLSLESARLLEETRQHSEQLDLLQEVTAAAAAHIKVKDLLEDVSQRILAGFNLSYCGAFLFDAGMQSVTCITDIARDPGKPEANIQGKHIPLEGNGAFHTLISTQKTAIFYNVQNDPQIDFLQDTLKKRGSCTLILTPLLTRGDLTGALSLELDDARRHISKDDQQLLDQISLQVAVALDVARLFEQTEQKAERERLISEITAKVRASTNVDVILQTSVKELVEALHIPHGAVHLKGGNGGKTDG
jgi:GAF domain-containing protein/HAMP domain-containing protein